MSELLNEVLPKLHKLSLEEKLIAEKELHAGCSLDSVKNIANGVYSKVRTCPHCNAHNVIKWGKPGGIQRYKCKACGQTFNPLTGTPMAHLHKKSCWTNMCDALSQSLTVHQTAAKCGVAPSTAFRWRHRFLQCITAHDSDIMNDVCEFDEMFFSRSYKGTKPEGRESRHRGGCDGTGTGPKVGVLFAVDRQGHELASVLPNHRAVAIRNAMEGRVAGNCVLCLDGGSAVLGYAIKSGHEFKVTSPGRYVFLPDRHYHIQTVNSCHGDFRGWMKIFRGVATKYLQNYAGWRRCMRTQLKNSNPLEWLASCMVA